MSLLRFLKRRLSPAPLLTPSGPCTECHYGSHAWPRHHPTCSQIDHASAKELLSVYLKSYTKREAHWLKNYRELEGRFAVLRHENNTLRAKLRKAGILKH